MALRMLAVFWALMSVSGLVTELVFSAAGLVPTSRPTVIANAQFQWDYTTYLNLLFLAGFGLLYWLHKRGPALRAAAQTTLSG